MARPFPLRTAGLADGKHDRLLWITPDRVFYGGLLGAPGERVMGSVMVYAAPRGRVHVSFEPGTWLSGDMIVVPPYTPHRVACDDRVVLLVKIEAETVDLRSLPHPLSARGPVEAPALLERIRALRHSLCATAIRTPCRDDMATSRFDHLFFGLDLPPRRIDRRIQAVVDHIKVCPSDPALAERCAENVHLSFSRFLHLFRAEVGVPFRSFRTWKRARSLLEFVDCEATLANVALEAGYPDSTHFSHSIRQVYGLKPRDIMAGCRTLAVLRTATA